MRQAELRVRAAGSSRSRAAVQPDPVGGRQDGTVHLRPGPELEKAEREVAEYERFRALVGQVTEVNEAICEARPAGRARPALPPAPGGEKGGSATALAAEKAAEVGRLAAEAARVAGLRRRGLEAAEPVIRAGLLRLGGGMLERAAGRRPRATGARGWTAGPGTRRSSSSYRDKTIDTVLGPVTVTRAWYHCAACGHGLAPRGRRARRRRARRMSPGLAAMTARAAAAVPFARAARAARRAGRDHADRQAGRAGRRGQRRRPPQPPAGTAPGSSPPARWSRCRPRRCRTSCTSPSTAPACR